MIIFLSALHIIVCVFLVLVVLLQSGKGADLAGAFGGGGTQTALGARGAATILGKLTTAAAIAFMLTSLTLSIVKSRGGGASRIKDIPASGSVLDTEAAPPAGLPSPVDASAAEEDKSQEPSTTEEPSEGGSDTSEEPPG